MPLFQLRWRTWTRKCLGWRTHHLFGKTMEFSDHPHMPVVREEKSLNLLTRPRRVDIVLIPAQLRRSIHDDRVSLENLYYLILCKGKLRTLGPKPYLWVSQLILVTPSREKSNGLSLYLPFASPLESPVTLRKGTMNEPRQQSTCKPILCFLASAESWMMSSWFPSGKLMHEPASLRNVRQSDIR